MMKYNCLVIIFFLSTLQTFSQNVTVQDFTVKTTSNAEERTEILDAIRTNLYNEYKITMVFVVNHLKVSKNYGWFEGLADRKDGKALVLPNNPSEGLFYDCCHVEALLQKLNGRWTIAELGDFSTDVWYAGMGKNKYPNVPIEIFPITSGKLFFNLNQ